ncbi:hypothetical protein SSCI18S_05682 [Sphingobium scionense]
MLFHRTDQRDATLDLAVIEHDGWCRELHGRAARAAIDQQLRARRGEKIERAVERGRTVPLAPGDGEQLRLGAGARVDMDGPAVGDDEAFGLKRLQPEVIDAAGDGALDLGVEELLKGRKQDALQFDSERQQPVEEGSDRRQLILDAVVVHQLQAGGVLEHLQRAAIDLAADQQQVKLAERVARIVRFQIVLGPGTGPGLRSGAGRA